MFLKKLTVVVILVINMHDINRLPIAQMNILLRLWNSPNKMGFAEGREEGGSLKELNRKGLVEPAGKVGRKIRWKLASDKVKQRDINLMSRLVKPTLPAVQEGLIVQLLGEAKELLVLVSENLGSKGSYYFLQSLFLVLRQMGYFFTEELSPLLPYDSRLSEVEKDVLKKVKNVRDAIGHRESSKNFLSESFILVGGMNFKNGDVEIQYGRNKLYLIGEIFAIHKKLRKLFSSADELDFLSRGYGWEKDEKELQEAEALLIKKLKNPKALLNIQE